MKKITFKIFIPGAFVLILAILCSICEQSCKTPAMAIHTPTVKYTPFYIYIDTPKIHVLTESERTGLMNRYYEYNYKKYFSPEFDRLNKVITAQASSIKNQSESIKDLTVTLKSMRLRSIKRIDSMDSIQGKSRRDYSKLENMYFSIQKDQVIKNARQISNLNRITNILLAIGVTMILIIILLTIAVRVQWNRINKLYKNIANV